jgi:hypothetical protein
MAAHDDIIKTEKASTRKNRDLDLINPVSLLISFVANSAHCAIKNSISFGAPSKKIVPITIGCQAPSLPNAINMNAKAKIDKAKKISPAIIVSHIKNL